ncbi:MAG: DNA repair ATPase, partial [Zoogloeaceae bacterium]|nr:DNA repair ATPase [Zoogloeaceae bacterium]
MTEATPTPDTAESLVAASGSYDLLKQRLAAQGAALAKKTQAFNAARLEEFGRAPQTLLRRLRARTEHNCLPRDLTRIGDMLLMGYNVFIGLKKEKTAADVFALYRFAEGADELEALPLAGSFLDDPRFVADFRELTTYYRQASLTQLRVHQGKLLAAFQIGEKITDLRVFRWLLEADGSLKYQDNRGERDIALPPTHDFEWTTATRENHVAGRHPHVNILDTVFVETIEGDLTVKIENNTETGLGIYSEPVEDKTQSLADAQIAYARLGALILLRIRPYREKQDRYLVFNERTGTVARIDAIGQSCVQLPEDHGLIFPGGYYLQSGEFKAFDLPAALAASLRFKRRLRSPNGEDVLYIFYQPEGGHYALFAYNLIEKRLAAPILCQGWARFSDGRLLVFSSDHPEPSRSHPLQLWQTAFGDEAHAAGNVGQGFWGRIGNPELVRGIAELSGIARAVEEQAPTRAAYEEIIRQCTRALDAFFWLEEAEAQGLSADLRAISKGARDTLDEFEKVEQIRRETLRAIDEADSACQALSAEVAAALWQQPEDFAQALEKLHGGRGRLAMLKELRYADLPRIETLDAKLAGAETQVGEKALDFLAKPDAFAATQAKLARIAADLPQAATSTVLAEREGELDAAAAGLDRLSGQIGELPGGDAALRTGILDAIAAVYAEINRLRATAKNRRKTLGSAESAAEFAAQMKLYAQTLEGALDLDDTPDKCDESLTRLLAQLETLEGRFAEDENCLTEVAAQRERVYEAFSSKRQLLLDARNRRARAIADAAGRILSGIPKRVAGFADLAAVHGYFAADPLLTKLRAQIADLRALGDAIGADDLDTRLATARDQAIRRVRDQSELMVEDGAALRFGRHTFTVNRQPLELTLVPREGSLQFHLSGTDYYAPLPESEAAAFAGSAALWAQILPSETPALYRGEYLAGLLMEAVLTGEIHESGELALSWEGLQALSAEGQAPQLLAAVRAFAAPRYQEGYQKGVHDADAARILAALTRMQGDAGLLSYGPDARALAMLYWQNGCLMEERAALWRQAKSAAQARLQYGARQGQKRLTQTLIAALAGFAPDYGFAPQQEGLGRQAARYLARQLAVLPSADAPWPIAAAADDLAESLRKKLEQAGLWADWQRALEAATPKERWQQARDWTRAAAQGEAERAVWADDAATKFALPLARERIGATLDLE